MADRYSADYLGILLHIVREAVGPSVHVFTREPDDLPNYMPCIVIRRTAGASQNPKFFDRPWISTQAYAKSTGAPGDDPILAAELLIDQVRKAYFEAWHNQTVVPDLGWIQDVRESSGPEELMQTDLPHMGRYQMLHEMRIRRVTAA